MNITEVVSYTLAPPESRRKEELSFCNVLFCLLVILIHTLAEGITGYDRSGALYFLAVGPWRLSSFVVQGFLFLSGVKLFLHGGKQETTVSFYRSRLTRVVLPYALAFCLFAMYFLGTGTQPLSPLSLLRDFFTGGLCGHFYFVSIICQFYLLMPFWRRMIRGGRILPGMLLSLLLTVMSKLYLPGILSLLTGVPFVYDSILFSNYLFYFVAGAWCGTVYDRFRLYLLDSRRAILITWAVLGVINWIFIYLNGRGIYYAPWLELFHMLYCIYAILGCLSLGHLLRSKPLLRTQLFRDFDKWSYQVYLLHPLVIFAAGGLFDRLGIHSLSLRLLLRTFLVYGSMTGLVYLCGRLSEKRKKQKKAGASPEFQK